MYRRQWLRAGERAVAGFDMGTKHYSFAVIAYTPPRPTLKPPPAPRKRKAAPAGATQAREDAPAAKKRKVVSGDAAQSREDTPAPPQEPADTGENVRVLAWRMIDLELDRVVVAYDAAEAADMPGVARVVEKRTLPPTPTVSGGKKPSHTVDIFVSLGRHLAGCAALMETQAACYIECQRADQKTGNGPLMATLSKATISAIAGADAAAGYGAPHRVFQMAAAKEGLKRASTKTAGVDYDSRKERSVELAVEALGYYGDTGATRLLQAAARGGWKQDDLCDALGIARRKARENHR